MQDIQGVVFKSVRIVSEISGGDVSEDGVCYNLYNNEIVVSINADLSDSILSVCHIEDGPSIWEVKEVGPFVYFSVFRIKELVTPSSGLSVRGAFGSKYLGVSSGGWSSRAECFNELGYTDDVIEITLITSDGIKTMTHITKKLAAYLVSEFDASSSYPTMSSSELVDLVEKEACYSKVLLADTVSDCSTRFINHSAI